MCPLTSLWREKSRTIFHWQTGNNGGKRAGQHLKGGIDFPRETNPIFWKASLVSKPTKVSFCFTSSLESLKGPRKSFSLKEELDGLEEWTKLILLSLRASWPPGCWLNQAYMLTFFLEYLLFKSHQWRKRALTDLIWSKTIQKNSA